jgi:hypothetical protein
MPLLEENLSKNVVSTIALSRPLDTVISELLAI